MKIEIINPRLVLLRKEMIIKKDVNYEQVARIIEKALLIRGINCDEIKVLK